MSRITVLYPNTPHARFDMNYYTKSHIELVRSLLGDALVRVSVYQGLSGPGGAPPAFVALTELDFRDMPSMGQALGKHGEEIARDVANFTTITPTVQIAEKIL